MSDVCLKMSLFHGAEMRVEKLEKQDWDNCPITPVLDFMGHDAKVCEGALPGTSAKRGLLLHVSYVALVGHSMCRVMGHAVSLLLIPRLVILKQ